MNISINNSNIGGLKQASSSGPAAAKQETASLPAASDSFTPSAPQGEGKEVNYFARNVIDNTCIALAGAAAGAISSTASGYWSVAAGLGSGAVLGGGGAYGASAINGYDSMTKSFATIGGSLWGGIGGATTGLATNLLETVTGLPRMATGAIAGAVINVALYNFASR